MSWNGATEVTSRQLYKTCLHGVPARILVNSAVRFSFETKLVFEGYANSIIVERIDTEGSILGSSAIINDIGDARIPAEVLAEEERWLQELETQHTGYLRMPTKTASVFCAGAMFGAVVLLVLRHSKKRNVLQYHLGGIPRYTAVQQ